MFWGLRGTVCPYWLCYKQLVWQFVWSVIHKEHQASCGEEGLSPRAWSVCSHTRHTHTNTHKHTNTPHKQAKKHSSVNTDPCERPGFMELMGGCMGTFPGGSFCLFFWWRSRRRRPSSSHHEDSRAARMTHRHTYVHALVFPQHTHTHKHTHLYKYRSQVVIDKGYEWSDRKQVDFSIFQLKCQPQTTVFTLSGVSTVQ